MIVLYLYTMICIFVWCRYQHFKLNDKLWSEHLMSIKLDTETYNYDELDHRWKVYILMRDNVYNRK